MSNRDDEELEEFELPSRDDRDDLDDDLDELDLGDDDDDDDDDDDYDDLEDAGVDDIDLVVGIYREDGQPVATALALDLANDLDELIGQLRRQPADAGAIGMVSLVGEVFAIVRVRGANVQVLLSDAAAAGDWPIGRDIADFLGVEEIPDTDDDSEPMGDLGLLADLGVSEFEMEAFCDDYDSDSDELLGQIADRISVGPAFRRAVESFD
ncbi:tRNA adenosine deaminase [Enemella dayhoffiae]|uniref:tRNA adenosine deaminase n=1 Tax=Enemella dayhoffiae TaxID=2016507 RepID=A0A255HBG3_9ACTN|nr:tRNA adenosine deaminase-associated protein [Enemella dayhoffiae]OYO24949.1 tRNA adenosine deaminase [Enemella dayhoffiae]